MEKVTHNSYAVLMSTNEAAKELMWTAVSGLPEFHQIVLGWARDRLALFPGPHLATVSGGKIVVDAFCSDEYDLTFRYTHEITDLESFRKWFFQVFMFPKGSVCVCLDHDEPIPCHWADQRSHPGGGSGAEGSCGAGYVDDENHYPMDVFLWRPYFTDEC